MSARTVRIGGASGAWGDSPLAIAQLLGDYLMMDYLAEVTMSLLARARLKDPQAGFPPDFVGYLKPHPKTLATRGIKVVSNAGGVNPVACKRALEAAAAALAAGATLADHARKRGVSLETVRSQMASIRRKTGCRRQAELVALVASVMRQIAIA